MSKIDEEVIETIKRIHISDEVLQLADFMTWLNEKRAISFCKWFKEDQSLHRVPLHFEGLATEFLQTQNATIKALKEGGE